MKVIFKARQTPFNQDATEVRDGDFPEGTTVSELAEYLYPGFGLTHFAVGGRQVSGDHVPHDGEDVMGWCVPGDPISGIIAGVATWIAAHQVFVMTVLIAASIGLNVMMAKKNKPKYRKPLMEDGVSDQQYGWDYNASNSVEEGAPIPSLYGKRMVIPPLVMGRIVTDNTSNESFLNNVYGVCEGGSGFNDVITYPHDDPSNNLIVADLNHSRWWSYLKNLNSKSGDGDLIRHKALYHATKVTDGLPVETDKTIVEATDGDYRTGRVFHSKHTGGKWYVELDGTSVVNKFVVYQARSSELNIIKRFDVYARSGTSSNWIKIAETGGATESVVNGIKVWESSTSISAGKGYRQFYFRQVGYVAIVHGRGIDSSRVDVKILEMKLFGELNAGGLNDRIALETTDGGIDSKRLAMANGTWASLPVEKYLDNVPFAFNSTRQSKPDRIGIHFTFPYGLYKIDDKTGNIVSQSVKLEAFIQGIGANGSQVGDKMGFFEGNASVKEVTDSAQKEKSLYYEKDVTAIGADSYAVTVRFAEPPPDTDKDVTECKWNGLDEGWNFTCVYPRTAIAGMKALATKSLSGGAPQFRILAERKGVYARNPLTGSWELKPANNPAWAAYDLLVHPIFDDSQENQDRIYEANRDTDPDSPTYDPPLEPGEHASIGPELYDEALVGYSIRDTAVSYEDFARWAKFCEDENITCSMYFDGTTKVGDALAKLLELGRASLVNRGASYGIWIDREADMTDAEGNPLDAYVFDEGDIVEGTWAVSYSDIAESPTRVNVTFYDREREWNRYTVSRSVEDYGPVANSLDVSLYACDDRGVAERHAEYLLGQRLIRKTYSWTGSEKSIPLEIGDIVLLKGEYVTVTSVTLDDQLNRQFSGIQYVRERFV